MEPTFKLRIGHLTTFTENAKDFVFDFLGYVHYRWRNMTFKSLSKWRFIIFIVDDSDHEVENYIKNSLEYEGIEMRLKFDEEKTFHSTATLEGFMNFYTEESDEF